MIKTVYQSKKDIIPLQFISSLTLFLVISFLLFYSFVNVCFQTLLNDPSRPLMLFCVLVLIVDQSVLIYKKRKITVVVIINILVIICILTAWILDTTWAQILGIAIFLKFPQIIQFNSILYDKLNTKYKLSKVLVVAKIFYVMTLVSHIIGCIFYLIDNTLIKQQYFGPIKQNPTSYYQGSLTCFTPIYALPESLKYVYCVYYSISLVSTVAFGDIIGKNYFQEIYVMFLLILATIGIGLILQQMIIYFRKQKIKFYAILKKLKYVKYLLTQQSNHEKECQRLVRFLINPNLSKLTKRMNQNILKQSIKQTNLPLIIKQYIVCHTKNVYFPSGYYIMDNQQPNQQIYLYILMHGKVQTGYGKMMHNKRKISYKGFLFSFQEFVINTKSINPYFNVITQKSSMFLRLSKQQLQRYFYQLKKNQSQYLFLLQSLQLQRQKCLSIQNNGNRFCNICQEQGHLAYQCKSCHYRPIINDIYSNQKRDSSYRRTKIIKNKKKVGIKQRFILNERQQKVQINKAVQYCNLVLHNYEQILERNQFIEFQSYNRWNTYHSQFNIF